MPKEVKLNVQVVTTRTVIRTKGKAYKFQVTNAGESIANIGLDDGSTPALSIPKKTDEGYTSARAFSTEDIDAVLGNDFVLDFVGGSGLAEIITFVANEVVSNRVKELIPGK